MANKKITQLTAITTLSSTDLSEVSLNGAGSRKETRSQQLTYMNNNVQLPSTAKVTGLDTVLSDKASLAANNTFTGSNTFSPIYIKGQQANVLSISTPTIPGTISAAELIGGIVYFNGISGVMALDSATNIRDALNTSLGVTISDGTAFRVSIMNTSGTTQITLAPGDDTIYYGQNVIQDYQTFDLIGIFTSVSLPSLSFYGSTDLGRYAARLKDNLFFGINTFTNSTYIKEIIGPVVSRNLILGALTGSGTLTDTQVVGGVILFDPALNSTWTFPLGADIDSLLGTLSINEGFPLTLVNQSSTKNVSFSENTGVSFSGLSEVGTLLLSPGGVVQVILTKTDANTFTLAGSSHGVFNEIPGDFHVTGSISGDGIGGNFGDINFPRFNEVVQNTCIQKNYNTTSTISAADLIRLTIVSNSVTGISLTLPTGSDLQSMYNFWATNDFAIENIYFINLSTTGTVTLIANTGASLAGVPIPIIPVSGTKILKARKVGPNSYIYYG